MRTGSCPTVWRNGLSLLSGEHKKKERGDASNDGRPAVGVGAPLGPPRPAAALGSASHGLDATPPYGAVRAAAADRPSGRSDADVEAGTPVSAPNPT